MYSHKATELHGIELETGTWGIGKLPIRPQAGAIHILYQYVGPRVWQFYGPNSSHEVFLKASDGIAPDV